MNASESALWLLTALLASSVAYASFVTLLLARAETYSLRQKRVQLLLVWLLPVVGAGVVHWFAKHGAAGLPPIERHPYREHELPE